MLLRAAEACCAATDPLALTPLTEPWGASRMDRYPELAGHAPDAALQARDTADLRQRAATGAARGGRNIPVWMVAVGAVLFAVSVGALAVLDVTHAGQRWSMLDLQIYRWGGTLARHGGDLYGSRFRHYHLRFTYPPMAALVFAALSAAPVSVLKWIVTVGSIAALTVTLWLTWGALGYRRSAGRAGAALAVAGVALWLQPVQQTLSFGQVNLILMLIVVADLCLPDSARAKGIGVGLAAGFKLTPLIFIGYLLVTGRIRAACVALATFTLTIAGSLILLPAQARRFWFGGLFLDSHRTGNNAYVGNQSMHGALERLLGGTSAAEPYWLASAAVVGIAGLVCAAWAARRGHEMAGLLTCALTGLLISPVSWSHHWVWAAPALVVGADSAIRARARPAGPGGSTVQLPGWRPWPAWRGWACWIGVAALAGVFYLNPATLVPGADVQGTGAHGADVLLGDLYVIAGLAALCFVGFWLIRTLRPSG
jgi:alpha-1,2-mannosyltransferase